MAINLSNLSFSYRGRPDKRILEIEHWSVKNGERVFLCGPSGSGKSTLLSILSGLLRTKRGEVSVLGRRLDKMSARKRDRFRANHIGYVFQQFNLIPYLNALDNIRLACRFSKQSPVPKGEDEQEAEDQEGVDHKPVDHKRVDQEGVDHKAVDQENLEQASGDSKPLDDEQDLLTQLNIPESDWTLPVRNLSIGQQQRVAIARAIFPKPRLLIADEPTSSLDQDNRDLFMSLLMNMAAENNTTLIFVSHDRSLSWGFERVDAMSDINSLEKDPLC